jgi:saccharopine dehydrogenase (NAD+, L-lysine forming)
MVGASLMLTRRWHAPGVFNVEQLDPEPYLAGVSRHGLPWTVEELSDNQARALDAEF